MREGREAFLLTIRTLTNHQERKPSAQGDNFLLARGQALLGITNYSDGFFVAPVSPPAFFGAEDSAAPTDVVTIICKPQ